MQMKKIQLIIGSTRDGRLAPAIAQWIQDQAAKNNDIDLEVVDLKEVNLPIFHEATPPAYAPSSTDAGKAWASKVGEAEGYIFLTPEYNRGYTPAIKNAIDYLVEEWKGKPATVVSYGYIDGGGNANKQLHEVLAWHKMQLADEPVAIHLNGDMFNEDRSLKDTSDIFAQYEEQFQTVLAHLATADKGEAVSVR